MIRNIFLISFLLLSGFLSAQIDSLTMDINFKTRAEGNNGYSTLIPEGKKMKSNVLSRARIGMNFHFDKLELRVAGQDARVWGDTSTSSQSESVSFYEAWAKYNFTENFYLKAGRQGISFDNGRLIWESDWGMAGKTFDALRLGFELNDGSSIDVVVTYNSQSSKRDDSLEHEEYMIYDGDERIKTMQLVHYQSSQKNNFKYSAILMNNVVQTEDGSHNSMTTAGLGLKHQFSSVFDISAYSYYQFGKNTEDQDKSAYDFALTLNYSPVSVWKMTLGGELVSGTKYAEDSKKNKSFSPVYTTSHTFNGYMDYFFARNHFNGPGLVDLNLRNKIDLNRFGNLYLAIHYFSAHQKFNPTQEKYLGTELDLVYGKTFGKYFLLNLGYSQMFASDGLKMLKGVSNPKSLQNFVWIGLSFNPKFKLL